jgi:hypothetical protein
MIYTGFVAVIRGNDEAVTGGHANLTDHNNGTYDVTAVFAGKGRQQLAVYVPGVTRRTSDVSSDVSVSDDVSAVFAATTATTASTTSTTAGVATTSTSTTASTTGTAVGGGGYKSRYRGTPAQARLIASVAAASVFDSHIPGSPFELYIVGSLQCGTEQLVSTVGACGSDSKRPVTYSWGVPCSGGLALPENTRVECDAVPRRSSLGITIIVLAALTAAYAAMFLVFIYRNIDNWVVKYSQVSVELHLDTMCIHASTFCALHVTFRHHTAISNGVASCACTLAVPVIHLLSIVVA